MNAVLEVEEVVEEVPQPSPPVEAPDTNPPEVDEPEEDPEEDAPSDLEAVAREVIAGHWGRGRVAREKLQEAGHDPSQVEEEMRKIING